MKRKRRKQTRAAVEYRAAIREARKTNCRCGHRFGVHKRGVGCTWCECTFIA